MFGDERKREEDDIYSVFSTMEDFEGEGRTDLDFPGMEKEDIMENYDLMVLESDVLALDTTHDAEIEEILQLSLEGVNKSTREVKYCSQCVINNGNKFSKKMDVL